MSTETMTATARMPRTTILDHAYRGQPLLAACGVLLLLAMIPTGLALGLDTRLLNGIGVWVKPLKFEASLALHLLTVAWLMLCLPEEIRTSRLARGLAATMAGAAIFEIAYIALQASRGEASHFNVATPFTGLMYTLMGVGAIALVATSAGIGALILRHGALRDPVVSAAGLGLVLGGILGGATGVYMSMQTGHRVDGEPTDLGGLPVFGWSRTGGDLRVAHFFGLHLMQILPVAAWLGKRVLPRSLQFPTIGLVAAAGTALTLATLVQAIAGRPLIG